MFGQNHGLQILWFLKPMFLLFRKSFLNNNRFFSIYFHDLLYGDTGGYTGYKGFQGVIGGYKELQGLRKDYRKLVFQLERLQTLFRFFSIFFSMFW